MIFLTNILGAKIPSEKAWGKKKTVYYDAEQYKEKDFGKMK